jgi:hypothetical protein
VSVRVEHFPEFGVTLVIYSGALTPEAMERFVDDLGPADAGYWINYLDPTLDLSGMDVAHIPVLKRALAAKLKTLYGEGHVPAALVTASPVNDLVLNFWPSYVGLDGEYPREPTSFASLEAVCDRLQLPEAARRALIEAADGRQAS